MKKRLRKPSQHEIECEGLPSASGFDAEFRCLGRRELVRQLPVEEDSSDAARGQRIHDALKNNDLSNLNKSEARTASRVMYAESELVGEYDMQGSEVIFEERYWDFDENFNHTWSAKIDTMYWQQQSKRLFINDAKTGWTLGLPVQDNWQMKAQAAITADTYGADQVIAALTHPHHADSLYEVRIFSKDELEHQLDIIREGVKTIQLPDQPLTYGPIQCHYCPAKRICPEYKRHSKELAQAIADEKTDYGYTAINRRSPEERGDHVKALLEEKTNIDSILEQYVTLAGRDGSAIKGYTLKRKMIREIKDEVKAMELVREQYGPDVLYAAVHFSLGELEEVLHKEKNMNKREAKAAAERLLAPILRFKTSKAFLQESRSY